MDYMYEELHVQYPLTIEVGLDASSSPVIIQPQALPILIHLAFRAAYANQILVMHQPLGCIPHLLPGWQKHHMPSWTRLCIHDFARLEVCRQIVAPGQSSSD